MIIAADLCFVHWFQREMGLFAASNGPLTTNMRQHMQNRACCTSNSFVPQRLAQLTLELLSAIYFAAPWALIAVILLVFRKFGHLFVLLAGGSLSRGHTINSQLPTWLRKVTLKVIGLLVLSQVSRIAVTAAVGCEQPIRRASTAATRNRVISTVALPRVDA